jgi:hypothetical protein
MIVVFRNFRRNKMVNLSATSVKHFMPDVPIFCFTFYKTSMDEYKEQPKLLPFIEEFTFKTKYVGKNDNHDDKDPRKTSGFANPDNGKYFTEGYNLIQSKFKNWDKKFVILAEDHFFTTGKVLKELDENDWHVAFASGYNKDANANGSIIGINPAKVDHLFPINETAKGTVEAVLTNHLIKRIKKKSNVYQIENRKWIDYCGDGKYTNSSEEIEEEMKKAGII